MKDAKSEAAWSTADERLHTLKLRLAITSVPAVKKHVVCAQIHDADDDLLMVRLEDKKLFIERPGQPDVRLDSEYVLGTAFDLTIQAGRGSIRVWHNVQERLSWPVSQTGCYFKVGCYTQSNVAKGDTADSYGEVRLLKLELDAPNALP